MSFVKLCILIVFTYVVLKVGEMQFLHMFELGGAGIEIVQFDKLLMNY